MALAYWVTPAVFLKSASSNFSQAQPKIIVMFGRSLYSPVISIMFSMAVTSGNG